MRTTVKPFRLYYFPTLRSTNDHAAAMRRAGRLYAPAIVVTSRQTAGRGRGDHSWWSGKSCLTVTLAIPVHEHHEPHQIPLLAGLATRNAAVELTGNADIQLKWPNDLIYKKRKLAGLLCERLDKLDLIGVGLNINRTSETIPPDIAQRVVFLSEIAGREIDINTALTTVARHMLDMLTTRRHSAFSQMLQQYDQHHCLIGQRVTILGSPGEKAITGTCQGLDSIGRLIVKNREGVHHIIAGNVVV